MEYLKLIPMLAHPENFGGDPDESFTVVVPSLPGFGFSVHLEKVDLPTAKWPSFGMRS